MKRFILSVWGRRWWVASALATVLLLAEIGFVVSATTEVGCTWCHVPESAQARSSGSGHDGSSCVACHRVQGVGGWVRLNIRAGENLGTWAFGREGQDDISRDVPESRCRSCHGPDLEQPVEYDGTRMSHQQVAAAQCVDCHVAHADSPIDSAGDPHRLCRSCHRDLEAEGSCTLCHIESPKPAPMSQGEGEDGGALHPPGWSTTHGMGNLASCPECHQRTECARCHAVELPHEIKTFIYTHGDQAVAAGQEACLECHQQQLCEDCHASPMPHPIDYLPQHSGIARVEGTEGCLLCHLQAGCDNCHTVHIHPGIPSDKLRGLRSSAGLD